MAESTIDPARRPPETVDEALAYVERVVRRIPEHERTWSEVSLVLLAAIAGSLHAPPPNPPNDCRLAYQLHKARGFHCRRAGGRSICGLCVGDVLPWEVDALIEKPGETAVVG